MTFLKRRQRPKMGVRQSTVIRSDRHRQWVKGFECLIAGKLGHVCWGKMDPHHVRKGSHTGMGATLTALKASIRHWEENVAAETPGKVKLGSRDCALCRAFQTWSRGQTSNCAGCPVAAKTGQHGCEGTPYRDAVFAHDKWDDAGDKNAWRTAAQAELDFLRSLLPEQQP